MDSSSKKNNAFLYILIVILFLALGITLGVYGTKKYLSSKENDDSKEVVEGALDITDKKEYASTIEKLYSSLGGNPIYYSSKGFSLETMDNNTKLSLVYNYITSHDIGLSEQLNWSYWGANTCDYNFIVDPLTEDESGFSQICTILRVPTSEFVSSFKALFNSDKIDTSVDFSPSSNKNCVLDGSDYVCGTVDNNGSSGSLDGKFEILKVTLENDIISIYDKGYLIDTRSDKVDLNDGNSNHYLHTSDSTNYYYELKSADNVTFKHDFKKSSDGNYYYVSTSVVEKE